MKPCLNNGYRSFSSSSHCICPEPYFGEQCEKYCDQGQRMKGLKYLSSGVRQNFMYDPDSNVVFNLHSRVTFGYCMLVHLNDYLNIYVSI